MVLANYTGGAWMCLMLGLLSLSLSKSASAEFVYGSSFTRYSKVRAPGRASLSPTGEAAEFEQVDPAAAAPLVISAEEARAFGEHPMWKFDWTILGGSEVAITSMALFLFGILCSAAGIGGGGVYVAVLMLLGRLTPHDAVPLSKTVVFLGAVSSMVVNCRARSPSGAMKLGTVLDVDACRIVVPASLVGTFLGVLLNWVAHDLVVLVVLNVVLAFFSYMVWRQWQQQRLTEDQAESRTRIAQPSASSSSRNLGGDANHDFHGQPPSAVEETPSSTTASDAASESEAPGWKRGKQAKVYRSSRSRSDASRLPGAACEGTARDDPEVGAESLKALSQLSNALVKAGKANADLRGMPTLTDIKCSAFLLFIVVMSGVARFHMHACVADVTRCRHPMSTLVSAGHMEVWMANDATAWILQFLTSAVPLLACAVIAGYYGQHVQDAAGWSLHKVGIYQATALLTGVMAGLVGIGGGLILSPFFLLTGMDPALAVGTSTTCVFFTSASTSMQYLFTDRVIMPLAVVYGIVTMFASQVGTHLVHQLQDHAGGRRSNITMIVFMGVAASAVFSLGKLASTLQADPDPTVTVGVH